MKIPIRVLIESDSLVWISSITYLSFIFLLNHTKPLDPIWIELRRLNSNLELDPQAVHNRNSLHTYNSIHSSHFLSMAVSVDGGFSQWSPFSACNVSCGGGVHFRTRTCSNPFPANGGAACAGDRRMEASCNTHKCPSMKLIF